MNGESTTLKDIAQMLGVSSTTVHRALQGKSGVSAEMRDQIRQTAEKMGYRSNFIAAALKRKPFCFAVAMPEPSMENRYYFFNLWLGVREFLESVTDFQITFLEYTYPLVYGSNGEALKQIYEQHSDQIDALLTVAVKHPQSSYFIEKFAAKNIPVALVGADLCQEHRFCCVKTYDEMAGSMAAELLTAFRPSSSGGKIIVTGNLVGNLAMLDQYDNSRGFEWYLSQYAPDIEVMPAFHTETTEAGRQIRVLLEKHPDTYAIYACSARHTVQMCRTVREMGLEGRYKLIGNDRFPESLGYLRQGLLTAIIDKKIVRQSALAMQTLFNYVAKSQYPETSVLYVKPSVLLRSNVDEKALLQ